MANEITSTRRGNSLVVTFNRPERANAMTVDMATQLYNTLKNVTTDRSVRAVLLCGAGEHFMNGMDLNFYTGDLGAALERANQLIQPYHSAIREIQAMDKPVLAAVHGMVTGAGMSLMLAADLVIAGTSARFNCKFSDYAMTPDGGCSYFLPRKIGMARAIELMMLSEEIDAAEAERLHLVNRTAEDWLLQEESLAMLDKLAEGPTRAYGGIKKLALKAFEQDLNAHLGLEHTYFGHSSRSFDFREAVKAHFTNRPAKFAGS